MKRSNNGHNGINHRRNPVNGHELTANKTVRAFDFILRSFGLPAYWKNEAEMNDYVHDLAVMLRHDDLKRASLELLAADQTVLYRHRVVFQAERCARSVDAAHGIELPLIPREQVADFRILMSPTARIDTYRGELRNNWGRAAQLAEQAGGQFTSDHTRHINGGRVDGEVFVTDRARRTATIINVSRHGDYAFARDAALPADVYLHRKKCEKPFTFHPRQRVSFLVIQAPKGLQGRNIRKS